MLHGMAAVILIALSSIAAAQPVTLAEVKAKSAVQLSADELKQLLPGAKVVNRTNAGSTRTWQNDPNGTLVASSDNMGNTGGKARPSSGRGTWRLSDQGTYCVSIKWNVQAEDWCRYVFKLGDKYYGFDKLDDTATASQFEFSK